MFEIVSNFFLSLGVLFFIVGTVGIFRFFDLYTRVHALTKIDNLGLGFIIFGLILKSDNIFIALKLILIWALALLTSSTLAYIFSSHSIKSGIEPKYLGIKDDY